MRMKKNYVDLTLFTRVYIVVKLMNYKYTKKPKHMNFRNLMLSEKIQRTT